MSRNSRGTEPEFLEGAVRVVDDLGMAVADVERLGFRIVEHWSGVAAVSERDAYAISKRLIIACRQREAEQERKMAEFAARFPVARGVPAVPGMTAAEQMFAAGEGDRSPSVFEDLLVAELTHGKGT